MTTQIGGTTGITFPDASTQNTAATGFGFKNRIINGAMQIDQRNAGASVSTSGGTVYTLDRWYVGANGASATVQQVTGATANQYRLQVTGASGITSAFLVQRIESKNSADLAGQTVTLSFDMANSLLTSVSWNAYYANSTDSFGSFGSPTVTSISGGTVTISSTVTRYSVSFAVPSAANTGIMIQLSVGAQTSGTWTIGNVQLEKGSTATSFDYRPYGTELALCQRYYAKSAALEYYLYGAPGGTYACTFRVSWPVTMRASPTYTKSTSTTAYANISNVAVTTNYAWDQITATTSTNVYYYFSWTASAEL